MSDKNKQHTCPKCGQKSVTCPKCGEEIPVDMEPVWVPYPPYPYVPYPYRPIVPWQPPFIITWTTETNAYTAPSVTYTTS